MGEWAGGRVRLGGGGGGGGGGGPPPRLGQAGVRTGGRLAFARCRLLLL